MRCREPFVCLARAVSSSHPKSYNTVVNALIAETRLVHRTQLQPKQATRAQPYFCNKNMMTSSNGNIFHVTGPLRGEFTGSPHKGRWRGALMFSLICAWINLSKQSRRRWFETPSRSLWRHCDELWLKWGSINILGGMATYTFKSLHICGHCIWNGAVWRPRSYTIETNHQYIKLIGVCTRFDLDLPTSQISECTCSISHSAPFRTEMCTFLFWMEHCGIWNRCILGFVELVYWALFAVCYLSVEHIWVHFTNID